MTGARMWSQALLLVCSIGLLAPTSVHAADTHVFIRGGTVVNADQEWRADVLITNDLIAAVGLGIQVPAGAQEVDATGQYVMPGGIDPHTHMSMPMANGQEASDDFFSGQAAALAGGTTMHIDFALPIEHDLQRGLAAYKVKAAISCMDYSFHMAITNWGSKTASDMALMVAEGINSFKFFMAYKGIFMVTDEELLLGLQRCKELGALPLVHCENGDAVVWGQTRVFEAGVTGPEGHALSRPAVVEGEATGRAIRLAGLVNVPLYVVHVMSIDAMEEVAHARKSGQRVLGEAVISALAVDEGRIWDSNFTVAAQYVMSPPIHSARHRVAIKGALALGVLQVVATDHAVFNSTQKAQGRHDFRLIPNGVNGVEERMAVTWHEMVHSGLVSPSQYVRMTSTACAQTFNLYPRKGVLAPGSDADVIVLDPRARQTISAATHHSQMDTNVYEGMEFVGKVVVTVSRGRIVWRDGRLNVTRGSGRYLSLPTHGPLFAGLDKQDDAWLQSPYGPTPMPRAGDDESAAGSAGSKEEL